LNKSRNRQADRKEQENIKISVCSLSFRKIVRESPTKTLRKFNVKQRERKEKEISQSYQLSFPTIRVTNEQSIV
jgi:hypothetical protein